MLVDPVAAAIVMRHAPHGHRCVGLDVTTGLRLDRPEFERRFATTPVLQTVLAMAEAWFSHADAVTFHDPLAAAVVFEPSLCQFDPGKVRVDYAPDAAVPAATSLLPHPAGRQRVASAVDPDRFFAEYFGRVGDLSASPGTDP